MHPCHCDINNVTSRGRVRNTTSHYTIKQMWEGETQMWKGETQM